MIEPKKKISPLRRLASRVYGRYFMRQADLSFIAAHSGKRSLSSSAPVVLVQCVENYYYLALFDWLIEALRTRGSFSVNQFVLRSLRQGASRSPWGFLKAWVFQNSLTDSKWIRLYSMFCDRVAYRSAGFDGLVQWARDVVSALQIWRGLKSNEDVLALRLEGVRVGDLIYDSYLRFKPAPTMSIGDRYLAVIIWQAIRDVRRAEAYFRRSRPLIYLTSYSTYIQHGIAVRVALKFGVRVFSFGNRQEIFKELRPDDWIHLRNPDQYRSDFSVLSGREDRLSDAEKKLAGRLAGEIDTATNYMSRSAYSNSGAPIPDSRGALVVFLHDFFDSPHCYRWMVYPDFWEWTLATMRIASKLNLRILLKPHPNQIAASAEVVNRLKVMFPGVEFLAPNISNRQLADAGILCAVTVYGTVAHEMAYLGVPVIAAGDHPHVSFDFCRTATSTDEYAKFIGEIGSLNYSKHEFRRQSLEFYYMHNLNFPSDYLRLRDLLGEIASQINAPEKVFLYMKDYARVRSVISAEPCFRRIVDFLGGVLWPK